MFGSAAGFGLSGPFVAPLMDAGWSPASAVAVRAFFAGLVLLISGLLALNGQFHHLWRSWELILAYALIAVVSTQLFYFAAVAPCKSARQFSSNAPPRCWWCSTSGRIPAPRPRP